jgi:glucose-6-phosphate 1-dehydrogenase
MSSSGEEDPIQALSKSGLSIVVVGASGDLAKKKTYPSLLNLYLDELLPKNVKIWGYARSQMTDEELRDRLKPYLEKEMKNNDASKLDDFLSICHYQGGTSKWQWNNLKRPSRRWWNHNKRRIGSFILPFLPMYLRKPVLPLRRHACKTKRRDGQD